MNYIHKAMVHSAAKVWRDERRNLSPANVCYNSFAVMVLTLVGKVTRPATPMDRCKDRHLVQQAQRAFEVVANQLTPELFAFVNNLLKDVSIGHTVVRDRYPT